MQRRAAGTTEDPFDRKQTVAESGSESDSRSQEKRERAMPKYTIRKKQSLPKTELLLGRREEERGGLDVVVSVVLDASLGILSSSSSSLLPPPLHFDLINVSIKTAGDLMRAERGGLFGCTVVVVMLLLCSRRFFLSTCVCVHGSSLQQMQPR